MKHFPILLGFYLLALAIVPCADGMAMGEYNMEEALGLESPETGNHDHDHEAADYCSPLCSCNCCHITLRSPVNSSWRLHLPVLIITKTPVIQADMRDFACLDDIWQPPRSS